MMGTLDRSRVFRTYVAHRGIPMFQIIAVNGLGMVTNKGE